MYIARCYIKHVSVLITPGFESHLIEISPAGCKRDMIKIRGDMSITAYA